MRIHTNNLTTRDLASHLGMPDDVNIHVISKHGSRTHKAAYEVALRGVGDRHKRSPNTRDDSMFGRAATYDDWGQYLANLYKRESGIVAGPYKSRTDFHQQTKNQYA